MGTSNIFLTTSESLGKTGTSATGRTGAVEIHSFDLEVEQVGSQVGGKPRAVEGVEPGAFKVTKAIDGTSPLFFQWCCVGEFLGWVSISCYSVVDDTPYAVFKMNGVHVAKYAPGSEEGGLPIETLEFKYGKLTVTYNGAGLGSSSLYGNGSEALNVEKSWSWVVEQSV